MNDEDFKGLLGSVQEMVDHAQGKITLRSNTIEVIPVPEYSPQSVRSLRENLHLSRAVLGELIGVSPKTIESWERGLNHPTGPARRMFQMIERNGIDSLVTMA